MPYSGSIQIVNDNNGTAYAFLADNGLIWQCQWNSQLERWDKGQPVPGADGGTELQALVVEDLWPTTSNGHSPGIVLAYRVGKEANSKVYASFGAWNSAGNLIWTEGVSISNEQGNDEAFELVRIKSGQNENKLKVVIQKRELELSSAELLAKLKEDPSGLLNKEFDQIVSGIRPDSDLYVSTIEISTGGTNDTFNLQLSEGADTTALSLARTTTAVASPELPFTGNSELSRQKLIENTTLHESQSQNLNNQGNDDTIILQSSNNTELAESELSTNTKISQLQIEDSNKQNERVISFAAPSSGNTGIHGLGFTRYRKNPKSISSVALFPTRFRFSTSISNRIADSKKLEILESNKVNYYNDTVSNDSFIENDRSIVHKFGNYNSIIEETSDKLLEIPAQKFSDSISYFERTDKLIDDGGGIDKLSAKPRAPISASSQRLVGGIRGNDVHSLSSGTYWQGYFGGLVAGQGGYQVINSSTLQIDDNASSSKLASSMNFKAREVLNYDSLTFKDSGGGFGGSLKTLYDFSNEKLSKFISQQSAGVYVTATNTNWRKLGYLPLRTTIDFNASFSALLEERYSASSGPDWLNKTLGDIGLTAGLTGDIINLSQTQTYTAKLFSGALFSKYLPMKGGIGPITAITTGVLGIASSILAGKGDETFSWGVGFAENLDLSSVIWPFAGIKGLLGSQQNSLWTPSDGNSFDEQIIAFGSAGASFAGGAYVPLFNSSYTYNTNPESLSQSQDTSLKQANSSTQSNPTTNGSLYQAPTGPAYPFNYAPSSSSDSLFVGNKDLYESLTASPTPLEKYSLESFDANAESLIWISRGNNLTDGNYTNVQLIGLSLPGSEPAVASFTVKDGMVDQTTLEVTVSKGGGAYLGIPSPSDYRYAFGLDIFSQQAKNPKPPATNGANSVLEAMPVIGLGSTIPNLKTPLQISDVQRIQQQVPITSLNQAEPYPLPDGSNPTGNELNTYTYSSVPVELTGSQTVNIINSNTTATIKLSNGTITNVELSDPLYFTTSSNEIVNGNNEYNLELKISDYLSNSSISNPTLTIFSQFETLNDFTEQDSFSSNSSKNDAGVYLSSGLSDQVGLLPSFGTFPICNRVSYVDGSNITYLNNTASDFSSWESVTPSELSIKNLYENPSEYQFTLASSPTAITVPADINSSDNSGDSKTTYVFWIEPKQKVIPVSGDKGEENYMEFLNAIYSNQRINYSYGTTSQADTDIKWNYLQEEYLYTPDEGYVITDLRSFNVDIENEPRSLLVWTEVPLDILKQAFNQEKPILDQQSAVIKTGLINQNPQSNGYGWAELIEVRDIPWNNKISSILSTADVNAANITIEDQETATFKGTIQGDVLSVSELKGRIRIGDWIIGEGVTADSRVVELIAPASYNTLATYKLSELSEINTITQLQSSGPMSTPVLSWSQVVRTPYNEAVLNSDPSIFIPFSNVQPGLNSLDLVSSDSFNTDTFASNTGLSTSIQGPLTKSTATAIRNEQGLGVLATGLGSFNSQTIEILRNVPTDQESSVGIFEGTISGNILTVSKISNGELKISDLIVGEGVTANTRIVDQISPATGDTSSASYQLNVSSELTTSTTLRSLPTDVAKLTTFSGSFSGNKGENGYTTLNLSGLDEPIQIGDRVLGLGIFDGVTVEQVSDLDLDAGTATLIVDQGPETNEETYGLASIYGGTSIPYTIEFWTNLGEDTNPVGAGLVALGQPSSSALPDRPVEMPDGWLLSSSFVVEKLTNDDALKESLIASVPSGESSSDLYGWRWGLVATGTNTTAMDGTGGRNLTRNSLLINNLTAGDKIRGVNTFLESYNLTPSDLVGIANTPADQIASIPTTFLEFATTLEEKSSAGAEVATTSLNSVGILTDSALMNGGLILADAANANPDLKNMLSVLSNFQKETGEAKVNFDLKPDPANIDNPDPIQPPVDVQENYGGYALELALLSGPAVSVNGEGQIAYDVADGVTIFSDNGTDLRDGQWHYVAVSFLPNYVEFNADETLAQVPTNVGTAYLYVDGKQVAQQSNIIDPYLPNNLNDNAQLLSENSGGAIDLLAFYDKALTTLNPLNGKEEWAIPTSTDALKIIEQETGYVFEGLTPHLGEEPGAINNHYLAHTVDPNDALNATFTSVLLPESDGSYSWSETTNFSPLQELTPTETSASNTNLADAFLVPINAEDWQPSNWYINEATQATSFNPANRQLKTITAKLTPTSSSSSEQVFRNLGPDEILLGGIDSLESLETLQPFASRDNLQYSFLSSAPALNLKISPAADVDFGETGKLQDNTTYSAKVTLTFTDGKVVSNESEEGTQGLALGFSSSIRSTLASTAENANSALATSTVLEQAPLQLKYVDSGVQFSSEASPSDSSPATTFGSSQVYGSYANQSDSYDGWIAVAQPNSSNAASDPAGRIWIQYAGSFTKDLSTGVHKSVKHPDRAASTWLNALSTSTFSPGQPNLPLLNAANNSSPLGGLLIKADPTAGWGQNLGANMLVANVNNDDVDDLIIAAPQANGGGAVVIIDGTWMQDSLMQATGETILDLSNPTDFGPYVTILKPDIINQDTDLATVANFGTALGFVPGATEGSGQLLIGAPNYLRTIDPDNEDISTKPVGALYVYEYDSASWDTGKATELKPSMVGEGGTLTKSLANSESSKSYWGQQLGSSIAVSEDGRIALSAPGVTGAMIYSGSEVAQKRVNNFELNYKSEIPGGVLTQVQLGKDIDTTKGLNNPGLQDVVSHLPKNLTSNQNNFLERLLSLQNSKVADATTQNNQAIQSGAVGAVTLLDSLAALQNLQTHLAQQNSTDLTITPLSVDSVGGHTFYGPNLFNTLGDSGFGSSLAFADLTNTNVPELIVGADQSGGGGTVYVMDVDPNRLKASDTSLGESKHLAIDFTTNLINAAAATDRLGNKLLHPGDVNQDGYQDLYISSYNAASSAGNSYVLFGGDHLSTSVDNAGTLSLASGSIGSINFVDGTEHFSPILSELGEAGSLAGQGTYGPGDYNADGYPDLPLGSGPSAKTYITYGHPYLEAISNLQLNRLTSDNGFMLDGLATTTAGSLPSIGDFNGDGYGDFISVQPILVEVESESEIIATEVRIGLGANTSEILADAPYNDYTFTVSGETQVLPAGDVNGDGLDDIALFLNKNISPSNDGNQGAGSTTGILYGRSSENLPVGSGFGFLSPTSDDGAPQRPLPALAVAGGSTDVAPSFIAAGSTIFAAVKGNDSDAIYFNQSKDSGATWSNWVDLSSSDNTFSTNTTPALSLFNNTLFLAYVTPNGQLKLSHWDPANSDLSAWSQPNALTSSADGSTAFITEKAPTLFDRGDSLAVIWINENNELSASSSTEPASEASDWTAPIQLRSVSTDTATATAIQSTTAASYTWLGTTPVLAVKNNGTIDIYTALGSGNALEKVSSLSPQTTSPSISSAPVLTTTDTGLALSYTLSDGSVNLSRLNFLNSNGTPLDGVSIDVNGKINLDGADLNWINTPLNTQNSGIDTSLASNPLSVNGNLMLANIRSNNDIWIDLIPNLPDSESNQWLNTTIQLPDGNDGWLISQTDENSSSTLTAVGDLNGDGNDDLIVTNPTLTVNEIELPDSWSSVDGGISPSTPALAQVDDTLYMAVQTTTNYIDWSSSTNNGASWSDWKRIPSSDTTYKSPSLANFKGSLYLSYLGEGNNEINITRLTDASSNTWSDVYQVSGGTQSALEASLVTESINGKDQLAIYYISTNGSSELLRTASSDPTSSSGWSEDINVQYNNGSDNQTASGPLAVSSENGQTVIAYQGGTSSNPSDWIQLTTSSDPQSSSTWALQAPINPGQKTGLGLTRIGNELLLSYGDSSSEDELKLQQFSFNNNNWNETQANSTPLISSGSNNVTILSSTSAAEETILFAGIEADGNSIEAKVASTSTQLPGLRLINGAPTPELMAKANDTTAQFQTIQLAPELPDVNNTATITASLNGEQSLLLTTSDSSTTTTLDSALIQSNNILARSESPDSAKHLFSSQNGSSWNTNTNSTLLTGNRALNTTTSFGDLNADGYVDYLLEIPETVTGYENYVWNVWNIKATGDVNGNGYDDILMSLSPVSVSTQTDTPDFLQTVLIDGELVNVNKEDDQQYGTFSLQNVNTDSGNNIAFKQPLNPYPFIENFDDNPNNESNYYGLRQSWIEPILTYIPRIFEGATITNSVNPDGAEVLGRPASVFYKDTSNNEDSKIYTAFKGRKGKSIWVASQSLDGSSTTQQQVIPTQNGSFVPGNEDSAVSAAMFKDKLYILSTDKQGALNLTGGDPSNMSDWSLNTQIVSTEGTAEYTTNGATVALIPEGNRLAIYFTGPNTNHIRYIYSTKPYKNVSPGETGNWGSVYQDGSYTKASGVLYEDNGAYQSGIVGTVFQNKTILAYYNHQEQQTYLLPSTRFYPESTKNSSPTTSSDWSEPIAVDSLRPTSITTDQSQLYLSDLGTVTALAPISSSLNEWLPNGAAATSFNSDIFIADNALKISYRDGDNERLEVADLELTFVETYTDSDGSEYQTGQKSIAGFSLGGDIDINGDGFTDMLVSDPSDPALSVDNQYALFGGDYLQIATQVGTTANDILNGTPLADVIYTVSGDDFVASNGGEDVILTGSGSDFISIIDNNFKRIDGGPGIDQLLLQGEANKSYDFRLDVPTPEYFMGTKLKNIESINSIDSGANTLSFDPKAITAINSDRVLFITPDPSDTIQLYSNQTENTSGLTTTFKRSVNYDTNFGGSIWNAYTTTYASKTLSEVTATPSPAIAYVLNPDPDNDGWLQSNVIINSAGSSSSSPISVASTSESVSDLSSSIKPVSSIASQQSFGDQLTLTSFKTSVLSDVSRFEVSRSNDTHRQVVAYASSTANSNADPGVDYQAVVGQMAFEIGERLKQITVPIFRESIKTRAGGSISLAVEEIPDNGQGPLHLVINTTDSDFSGPPAAGLISGFTLNPSADSNRSTVSFRIDTRSTTTSDTEPNQPTEASDPNALVATSTTENFQASQTSTSAQIAAATSTTTQTPTNSPQPGLSTVSSESSQSETSTRSAEATDNAEGDSTQKVAQITVHRRQAASTPIDSFTTLSETILVTDAYPDQADQGFDQDMKANEQVEINLLLANDPGTFAVSLVGTDDKLIPLTALGSNTPIPNPSPPTPDPEPAPIPQPEPAPIPQPEPAPIPQPEPAPIPQPEPAPIPQPEPAPIPQPEPAPIPQPEPAPIPEPEPGSITPIEVDGSRELLVIPFPDGEEQLITVAPETFTDAAQPIVEVEGGVANPLPIAISFNLIESFQQPLDLNTATAGGGTIASNAPAGINLSIDGVYFNSAAGADDITGSTQNDFIRAGANDDVIDSGNGDDLIRAGAGSDTITTGEGLDRVYYTADQLDGSADTVLDFSTSDRVVLGENLLVSLVDNVATFSTTIDGVERQSTLTFAGSSVVSDDIFITTT